ncbi:hypothetical protein OESDEN_13873 [Oesophagostomum dentatum]|uniref:IFT52 GIFT domain-containing protein n=1 Tax=Oesophagostomum dentatum TaxID=61180 RepID=A0A0B1SR50_OESDE|nr:hypothetical protein OESDEN_13873 [Oesophagostomum dentatum]
MPPVTNFAANPRYGQEQNNENSGAKKPTGHKIIINQSKKESFSMHSGLRGIVRRLKNAWTIEANSDEITDGTFEGVRGFILPYPKAKFNVAEVGIFCLMLYDVYTI